MTRHEPLVKARNIPGYTSDVEITLAALLDACVPTPGTSGQVLTSGGPNASVSWGTASSGTVTSIVAGAGLTGGTITTTGTIAIAATGATITQALLAIPTPAYASTINLDLSTASIFAPAALTGNVALTLTNAPASSPWVRPFTVILTQDATGSRTVSSWFAGFTLRWAGGSAPTLTTTANKSDALNFIQIGATTLLGSIVGQNY